MHSSWSSNEFSRVYLVGCCWTLQCFVYDDIQRYLSCTQLNATVRSNHHVDWYWKLGSFLLYGTGRALANVSFYVFLIGQSPDKMKWLAVGSILAVQDAAFYILSFSGPLVFTLCFDILNDVPLAVVHTVWFVVVYQHVWLPVVCVHVLAVCVSGYCVLRCKIDMRHVTNWQTRSTDK